MYRFVALIWNRRDREASREAAALAAQFANEAEPCGRVLLDGLAVFYWQPRTHSLRSYHLPSGSGLILGRLFKHSTNDSASSLVVDISEMEAARIVATNGRHLVSDFWGSYVAILHDASTGESRVLRDCSGKIPCWRISVERVTIVFSNVDDVLPLISDSLSINWRYVAAFLFFDDLRTRESGITGISEVLAGGCVAVDKDGVVADSFCWNPADVYRRSGPLSDGDDCASAIRQNTQDCVDAWASVFKRILHNLSGGFDSAVVLSCLRNSPVQPLVTCLNRFTDRAQEDERAFAREAARLSASELLEIEWAAGGLDLRASLVNAPRLVKPTVLSFGNLDARFRNELARRFGAEATWTGQGGDHIFFEAATNLTAADYIRDHWFGRRFFSAIHDAARLTNEPYWRVMHSGLRKGLLRSKWKAEDDTWGQQPFVVKESLPENTPQYISHPWLADVLDLPPGKQFHIYVLADLLNQTGPLIFEEGAPEHHPLVSQPLLELSVRIPTYELVRGGCGRALARAAFAGRIPESIRTRRSKGTTRTYTTAVISQNKNFIRELLLDGALVRQGLLSRAELDPYLSAGKPLRPTQIFPLVACVAAEAWIQSWTRYTAQRRVA